VANLSKTLHTNYCQYRSTFGEVILIHLFSTIISPRQCHHHHSYHPSPHHSSIPNSQLSEPVNRPPPLNTPHTVYWCVVVVADCLLSCHSSGPTAQSFTSCSSSKCRRKATNCLEAPARTPREIPFCRWTCSGEPTVTSSATWPAVCAPYTCVTTTRLLLHFATTTLILGLAVGHRPNSLRESLPPSRTPI